jgi:hypothetical protein
LIPLPYFLAGSGRRDQRCIHVRTCCIVMT